MIVSEFVAPGLMEAAEVNDQYHRVAGLQLVTTAAAVLRTEDPPLTPRAYLRACFPAWLCREGP